MMIDYKQLEEQHLNDFKDGKGELITRNFVDEKNKIMLSRLQPGASIGYHKHEGNSEIMYIISGTGHYEYDGVREEVQAGSVHYCPMNHSHALSNDGEDELVYFAIVPEHH